MVRVTLFWSPRIERPRRLLGTFAGVLAASGNRASGDQAQARCHMRLCMYNDVVNLDSLLADPHGARYTSTANHPSLGAALQAAIDEINRPEARRRMVEAVDRYDLPALAAVVREIENNRAFAAVACRRAKNDRQFHRLKQAVGVAVKLAMAEQGWVPSLTSDGRQDQGRLDGLREKPRWFRTARRYRPR